VSRRRNTPPNAESVNREVGMRIRKRRNAAGMTLDSVADHIGVSTVQVQRYELGQRTLDIPTVVAIAEKLRCAPADFFNGGTIDGLSKDAINTARLLDSLRSVGLRHTIKGFMAKIAAYDREREAT
jgi:transcriptional regulator with XRE-family HTH domain